MRQNRLPRLLGALGLAISLAGGTLFGTALAAIPKVGTTGTNLSPAFVSNGGLAAFTVTATDNDTSTLAQFFLTEVTGATVYAVNSYLDGVQYVPNACTTGGQLECAFGQVKPNQTVSVTVAFVTPSGSKWTPDFEFSTTGYVLGKNNSHGDAFPVVSDCSDPSSPACLTVQLTNGNGDKAGSYVWNSSQSSVADAGISKNNPQSTALVLNSFGFGATVEDGSVINNCVTTQDLVCPTTFFGQTSQVSVANGTSQPAFMIVIDLYKPGVNPNQVNGVYHYWNDGSGTGQELIITQCSGSPTPSSIPCFTATNLKGANLELTIWSYHNGNFRGY
jgi:hypothetical protein